MIYIITFLFVLAGICKAIADVSAINSTKDKLSKLGIYWWKKSYSSNNKYKYKDPTQGERFLLSTSLLVILTDAWHLFDFLHQILPTIGLLLLVYSFNIVFLKLLLTVTCLTFIKQIIFELFYRYLVK